ncbi:GHMP kinase [Candidatus Giovannonibacteria bacterium]|nr:GHMP kinase [Candidatus Giovannonibacteria bacterium]
MIITRTPLRISFVGGGSDLREYYSKNTGAVVSTAIDKYIYVMVNSRPDKQIRLAYSESEYVKEASLLKHNIIRECLKLLGFKTGIDITYSGDLPIDRVGTGLGASSSLAVGVLHALHEFKGEKVYHDQLAEEACRVEIEMLEHPIGKQDQYIAAFGGVNLIRFNKDDRVEVLPILMQENLRNSLENNLLLFYTGLASDSVSVLTEQKNKTQDNFAVLASMVGFTDKVSEMLVNGELNEFGKTLHQNWLYKKQLASKVSNELIDEYYKKGLASGAEGGKILGSGGGGFLLFYCKPEKQDSLRKALSDLDELKFKFSPTGSQVIYESAQ